MNWDCKARCDFLFEIRHIIHCLISKGVLVNFCWVPSHCNLYWNNVADTLAKRGASGKSVSAKARSIDLSCHEMITSIEKSFYKEKGKSNLSILPCPRFLSSILFRFRCNALTTKFVPNIFCVCSDQLSVQHIIFDCPVINALFQSNGINVREHFSNLSEFLHSSSDIVLTIVKLLLGSPIGNFLWYYLQEWQQSYYFLDELLVV